MKKQQLANEIASTKAIIVEETFELNELTNKLIALVGDEGETFETELGTVQVTQRTSDRLTDQYVVSFNQDEYMKLNNGQKLTLEEWGIVKMERKSIIGQAPRVVVRL